MRSVLGQMDHRLFPATEKSMESWLGRKTLFFCGDYNATILFLQQRFMACMKCGTLQTRYPPWFRVRLL